jgi:hypothetical protein
LGKIAGYFYVPLASTKRLSVTVIPLRLTSYWRRVYKRFEIDVYRSFIELWFLPHGEHISCLWKEQTGDDMKAQRGSRVIALLFL